MAIQPTWLVQDLHATNGGVDESFFGPFETADEADAWGKAHADDLHDWSVVPLRHPNDLNTGPGRY